MDLPNCKYFKTDTIGRIFSTINNTENNFVTELFSLDQANWALQLLQYWLQEVHETGNLWKNGNDYVNRDRVVVSQYLNKDIIK